MKKFTVVILAVIMLFSCMMPAYAAEVQTVAETEQTVSLSIVERIKSFLHNIIERLFALFGIPCPFCDIEYNPVYMEDAVKAYNDGVNAVKNYKGKVSVKKVEDIAVAIPDVPSVTEKIITGALENLTGTKIYLWKFSDGKAEDGTALTDRIEPYGREAALDSAGVILTEKAELKNGGTELRLVLAPEKSVYDGTSVTEEPVYNAGVISTLNFGALDLGPVVVHNAEVTYTETELSAEFDSRGRMTVLEIHSPMDVYATAKASISVTLTVKADITTKYVFTYGD